MTNNETQTDHHFTDNAASNTDIVEIQSLEDELKVDEKGVISCNEGESLIEMCISHDVKSWEEIAIMIKEKLNMRLIGRPWLANNGRLYKTVGFRTLRKDLENWKIATFNWQDSGVRAVASSKLYR